MASESGMVIGWKNFGECDSKSLDCVGHIFTRDTDVKGSDGEDSEEVKS